MKTKDPASLGDTIAFLQELSAKTGIMPAIRDYDRQRPCTLPGSESLRRRGWDWAALAARAGLQLRSTLHAAKARPRKVRSDVPPDVEAEIQAAFARGDNLPNHKRDWPLFAIPTGVERVYVQQPDGSVWQITRHYASIR
jgi:hypothetical protein